MSIFALKSAEIVGRGLAEGITTCQGVAARLREGSNKTDNDEIAKSELAMGINQMDIELRNLSYCDQTEELMEEVERCMKQKWEAQKLLNELEVRFKLKDKETQSNVHNAIVPVTPLFTRLPEIEMAKFKGDVLNWNEFWEQFCTNVHHRREMGDDVKITYLKSFLEGDAKETIGGLRNTAENYTIAVNKLKDRYAKPQRILDAHYAALDSMAPAKSTIKNCREVLNQIDIHMGILKSLGEDTNHNNFRRTLMKKFPADIIHDLRLMMKTKDNHTVDDLRSFIEQAIEAREESLHLTQIGDEPSLQPNTFTTETLFAGQSAGQLTSKNQKKERDGRPQGRLNKRKTPRERSKSSNFHKRSLNQASEPQQKSQRRHQCIFCKGNHPNDKCDSFTVAQRREWFKSKRLCFQCLRNTHLEKGCTDKRKCPHCGGFGKHNRCLCPSLEKKKVENATTSAFSHAPCRTILQTAVAMGVSNTGDKIPCRVLFDTGSEKSYISVDTVKKLKPISKEPTTLTIYTFGSKRPLTKDTTLVSVPIITKTGLVEVLAYVIPTTTVNIPTFIQEKASIKRHYSSLMFAADSEKDRPADFIIGNDFYYSFFTGRLQKISDQLVLLDSHLGWIVSGSLVKETPTNSDCLSMLTFVQASTANPGISTPDPALQDDRIRDLWELETIGITDSPKTLQDDEAVIQFNKSTTFENGRYCVKWPWAQYPPDLPINIGLALGRLKGLVKRLDASKLEKYDAVLRDQLSKGIIEQIQHQTLPKTHPVHYLSHHCVIQEGKTTKLRIVYDASAKVRGQHSLNDFLHKGPLMLEELTALLLRFRTYKIGMISDIEKAFLQLCLQEEDRDVTRFLWVKDISKDLTDDNIVHLRFCRVPFGVISSPFLLAATTNFHLQQKRSPLATQMAHSLYVDNLVTGASTLDEAITLYDEARSNFAELSMNIREWSSNSEQFMTHIPDHLRSQNSLVSVLGLQWDTSSDTLMLAFKPRTITHTVTTKRQALSVIASVFDPCGITAPLTLSARLFLQSLWIKGVKWDERLTTSQQEEWNVCVGSLSIIPSITVARYYGIPPNTEVDIHCFTDASSLCYSAVVYLRAKVDDKTVVSLVISKSRLTPLRQKDKITIPKLELLAVFIGTRLISYVQQKLSLQWSKVNLWTDSQIVLGWLKSTRLLHPFVSRRVEAIRKFTHVQFCYVPSSMNPADVATRPLSMPNQLPHIWTDGPAFLRSSPQHWPRVPSTFRSDNDDDSPSVDTRDTTVTVTIAPTDSLELPETGTVLPVSTIQKLQREFFPQEMQKERTSLSRKLGVFMDSEGVLRCEGRYGNALMPYSQKYPVLLPPTSTVTSTIIQRTHQANHHVGVSHTLALIRERYWIPKGRRTIAKVLRSCAACIKYGGGPYQLPHMPDLPRERVTYSQPFTYTGLDYLGPLVVSEGGRPAKRWVCLFTCLAVRAVHLEVVHDLTSEEFILALRRFAATRTTPLLVVSDNASQFKMAAAVLASLPPSINRFEWKFIPALSPWQGGFYERLIGLVKHCVARSLDRSLLTGSQLHTIIKEIEAVLNTRPLTPVGPEVEHILTPRDFLSPCGPVLLEPPLTHEATSDIQSQLILGWKRSQNFLNEFRKMFISQYLMSLREQHQAFHKQPRVTCHRSPALGDRVQLKGDHKNRALWKVGTITSFLPSGDGKLRTAHIALDGGQTVSRSVAHLYPLEMHACPQPPTLSHLPSSSLAPAPSATCQPPAVTPAAALSPPPATAATAAAPPSGGVTQPTGTTLVPPLPASASGRPSRAAAAAARQRIRHWTNLLFAAAMHRFD